MLAFELPQHVDQARADSSAPIPAIGSSSKQHARPGGERHRDLELAALAMTEIGDAGTSARPARPTRASAARAGSRSAVFAPGVAPEAERMTGMRLHRERDIVERSEIEEQRGDLERARQPELAAPVNRQRRDVAAVEADTAGFGRDLAGQLADQRGLAGAVRADDGVQFAGAAARAKLRRTPRRRRSAWSKPSISSKRVSHGALPEANRRCRR